MIITSLVLLSGCKNAVALKHHVRNLHASHLDKGTEAYFCHHPASDLFFRCS